MIEKDDNDIFDKFKWKTLRKNLEQDFKYRSPIITPSLYMLIYGFLCRTKKFIRFKRLQKRGTKKITQDLDMLTVLRS